LNKINKYETVIFEKTYPLLMKNLVLLILFVTISRTGYSQKNTKLDKPVPQEEMERIFNEIKTPYKYGVVIQQPDSTRMVDSPTVFQKDGVWYMSYIILMEKATKHGCLKAMTYFIGDLKGKYCLLQKRLGMPIKKQATFH